MFWLLKKLLPKRKPTDRDAVNLSRLPKPFNAEPEWKRVFLDSLRRNNLAPSAEVISHSSDLFDDYLHEPGRERGRVMAEYHADIFTDVALLRGLVPHLIEQTINRSPYAFSNIINHKELR
ncbi:hypothetical protein GOZ96_12335 [Agrobacterium vitis]|uniref:Uncharacterized protein n=1 Tax=Agrobacterium vitis TaxID=373 RepID=A0A368NR25_AGRVI|nr:hypothetical protein [Agrobacterium vitis]KAA3516966.1 hypothetical protein DXM22_10960 [Agrobacterium vitis]KAA3529731.1 hypothetical protein DXT89_08485 [Agrobacterium vitis]MUZ97390.1 hypothetical protein [Agrobacterium vitis]NOJ36232.1 hypothetical protein [Agrobacterium vitis]RCU52285.1 hypothetical protein ASB66_019320 [Agrobacterium vitis]